MFFNPNKGKPRETWVAGSHSWSWNSGIGLRPGVYPASGQAEPKAKMVAGNTEVGIEMKLLGLTEVGQADRLKQMMKGQCV